MTLTIKAALVAGGLFLCSIAAAQQTITFASLDSLPVTADTYLAHDTDAPLIVLFHQAGWSRGEYREIAPKLNQLGFNCLAVDLRSGGGVRGVANQTAAAASDAGYSTTYIDALPDIIAALRYSRSRFNPKQIIAWGSSYSAALVLKVARDEPALVDGVLAFAPGDILGRRVNRATGLEPRQYTSKPPPSSPRRVMRNRPGRPFSKRFPSSKEPRIYPSPAATMARAHCGKSLPIVMVIGVRCGYFSMKTSTLERILFAGLLAALPNANADFAKGVSAYLDDPSDQENTN